MSDIDEVQTIKRVQGKPKGRSAKQIEAFNKMQAAKKAGLLKPKMKVIKVTKRVKDDVTDQTPKKISEQDFEFYQWQKEKASKEARKEKPIVVESETEDEEEYEYEEQPPTPPPKRTRQPAPRKEKAYKSEKPQRKAKPAKLYKPRYIPEPDTSNVVQDVHDLLSDFRMNLPAPQPIQPIQYAPSPNAYRPTQHAPAQQKEINIFR
jgi:hypothetical protein